MQVTSIRTSLVVTTEQKEVLSHAASCLSPEFTDCVGLIAAISLTTDKVRERLGRHEPRDPES